jgi:hypothetical protein
MSIDGITIQCKVEEKHHPQTITPTGIHPPYTTHTLKVTLTNSSRSKLEWINVTLGRHEGWKSKRPATEDHKKETTTYSHWHASEVPFGTIEGGESRTVTHIVARAKEWSPLRIYGSIDGRTFVKWVRPPVTFGPVTETLVYDSFCFVATAAFQNPDHPLVQELRNVRDEILARSSPGRRFIAWYYRNGPAIADVVRPRPYLRVASRAVLTPIALAARANRRLRNYWKGPQ